MKRSEKRLSEPLYEGLPWIYVAAGVAALIGSYLSPPGALSIVLGLLGFLGVLAGIVVLLRRRGFREMRSQYGNPDSTLSDLGED
jgi:hypothetical protein